ncbi:amidohydrolase [Actinophytocola sp.]|uniref:amidohydrolase n=1 Tax=Actinophytocola sp. TaxID=1872138 RepID=UPI003D6C09A7
MSAGSIALIDGRILSMNDGPGYRPASVAIRHGHIAAIGERELVERAAGPAARTIPLGDRVVMPGLVDTHTHLAAAAMSAEFLDCRDFYARITSVNDILERLRAAASTTAGGVVFAAGSPMQQFRLAEGRLPSGRELDDAVPDRPVFLSFGAHVSVANRRGLELIGVSSATPDPAGGMIDRDANGQPTGILYERAQGPIRDLQEAPDLSRFTEAVERELRLAATRGVTHIHEQVSRPEEIRAYVTLARERRLPVRVDLMVRVIEAHTPTWALLDLGLIDGIGAGGMLSLGGVKLSVDGGFTGRASAWSPVPGEPCGNHPLIRIEQEELDAVVTAYHEAGMRICVHAIGDMATDMVLGSFARARGRGDPAVLRHRVEHMGNWLMDETRAALAKDIGVTPVPNPAFLHYLGREAALTLGRDRTRDSFPLRRLLDDGFPLTFGADAPIYWPIDPLRDAGVAVDRRTRDGIEIGPDQRITHREALVALTRSAAWLGGVEDRLGTVEEGKLADLVVLAGDPLGADGTGLGSMGVDATIVDGVVTWLSDALSSDTSATDASTVGRDQ